MLISVQEDTDKKVVEATMRAIVEKEHGDPEVLTLSEVLELLSVSRPWLLENVLYNPEIRQQIDIDKNSNGFVKYPDSQGGRYYFLASKTKEFFEDHFAKIFEL